MALAGVNMVSSMISKLQDIWRTGDRDGELCLSGSACLRC